MISFSVLASGFVAGMLLSVAPGPAATAVLTSTRESLGAAFKTIFQIFAADVLVTAGCLALYHPLSRIAGYPAVQIGAGSFLVIFSIYSFWKHSQDCVLPSPKSAFHLTLFNPGVWLSMITVIALLIDPEGSAIWFLALFALAFELGVFVWYLLLILVATRFSDRIHSLVMKLAFATIAVMGVLVVVRTAVHLT